MQKKVDAFRFFNPFVGRERQGVDSQKGRVVPRSDMVFEFGHEPRAPGSRCLKGGQALFKNLLVNHRIPPSGSRFEGDGGEGRGARSRSLDLTLA